MMKKKLLIFFTVTMFMVGCGSNSTHMVVSGFVIHEYKESAQYHSLAWGEEKVLSDGTAIVRHRFEVKNEFGQYVTIEKQFNVKDGAVVKVLP